MNFSLDKDGNLLLDHLPSSKQEVIDFLRVSPEDGENMYKMLCEHAVRSIESIVILCELHKCMDDVEKQTGIRDIPLLMYSSILHVRWRGNIWKRPKVDTSPS